MTKDSLKILPTSKLVFELELHSVDYNEQKTNTLKKEIAEKYGVPQKNVEIVYTPITVDDNGEKISLASDIISNIQDPRFQQELFKEYIQLKDIENVNFDEILDIDKKVNAFIDFDAYSKYKPYKVKYLKWDNYLSYGKNNYFDFTKINGLVLLTGQPENTSGKTTLAIDLLRFALFGKAEKSPTLDSVFNTYLEKETEVMVEAGLEIDGEEYVIRRTITRPSLSKRTAKSKAKQKVEYFRLINGSYDEIENCEGESGTQTNNIIRETVGNIDDFDLVISATAYTLGNLLRMGQTDKGKLFSRWLGLLTIEEKEKIAKELWKKESANLMSNKYNKATLETECKDMTTVIESNNKEIIESEGKLNKVNANIEKYNNEKIEIIKNRKQIKEELIRIDVATIENRSNQINNELTNNRAKMKIKKERYEQIKDARFDSDSYNAKLREQRDIELRQAELRTMITNLKNDNNRIEQLIAKKTCPTCGHEIDAMEQNNFIDKNNANIELYKKEGVENKAKLDQIAKEIVFFEQKRQEENELNRLKPEMSAIKVQIDNFKLQLNELERQKQEIETNKENIKYNNEIDNKIRVVDENIRVENNIKDQLVRQIASLKLEIQNYTKEIEKRNKIITEITKEETNIRNWNIYQELVGKNGIIKIVLRKALPIINNEVARLISGLCDFDVILSVDENNKITLDLVRDGVTMDLGVAASGWEGTVSSIALRAALANVASFSRSSVVVFDEVLSGVSSENVENVFKLFRRILPNYDTIIHICHDTTISDYHDSTVVVTKKNNISNVELR